MRFAGRDCTEKFVLVVGKVVHLEADDRFFNDRGEMDFEKAGPLSVMLGHAGMHFAPSGLDREVCWLQRDVSAID